MQYTNTIETRYRGLDISIYDVPMDYNEFIITDNSKRTVVHIKNQKGKLVWGWEFATEAKSNLDNIKQFIDDKLLAKKITS